MNALEAANWPHTRIPNFIFDGDRYPGMTAAHIATYAAARSFAYASSRSGKFGKCMAARGTIARRARLSLATVKRKLRDLETWGLIYRAGREEKYKRTVVRVFVDFPETFKRTVEERGIERAKADELARLDSIRDGARIQAAKTANVGHQRPPKNKWRTPEELPPIPDYIPFARRGWGSPETPMGVTHDNNGGHPRPPKNAVEEHRIKNTPLPSVAAPSPDAMNNPTATATAPRERGPEQPPDHDRAEIMALAASLSRSKAMPTTTTTEEQRLRTLRQQVQNQAFLSPLQVKPS